MPAHAGGQAESGGKVAPQEASIDRARHVVGPHTHHRRRMWRRRRHAPPAPPPSPGRMRPRPPRPSRPRHRPSRRSTESDATSDLVGRVGDDDRRRTPVPPRRRLAPASTTSRTRASPSRAARSCTASRPTPPTPGRRTAPASRPAGLVVITAVSDSLFQVSDAGETVPLLVESVDHNADYTEWTLHIREGIKFHDGTPLDGAAVKFNIDASRAAPLTAGTLTPIDTVTATGQDVVITIKGGPWVALPDVLRRRRRARLHVLADVAGQPARRAAAHRGRSRSTTPQSRRRPADGDPAKPIGLGAFKFESYTPGNGNAFRAVRNDDYWRGPNGITGEDLPYLDAIEAVVAVDIDSRQAAAALGPVRRHAHRQLRHHQPAPRGRRPRGLGDEPLRRHVVLPAEHRGRGRRTIRRARTPPARC